MKKLVDRNIKKIRNETSQVRYNLPKLGEKAVLKLPLNERPTLDLTDKEIRLIFKVSKSATKKILVNQIEWRAYADIADAVVVIVNASDSDVPLLLSLMLSQSQ